MNIVAINRKPQGLMTRPCPVCRKPAKVLGRVTKPSAGIAYIAEPAEGFVRVWMSCLFCQWSGETDIDGVPA